MNLNLGYLVERAALFWPEATAVACRATTLTYAELDERTNRLAHALVHRYGLATDAAVATYSNNLLELVEVEVALYKAGLVRVPLNARLNVAEVAHILDDAAVEFVFVGASHLEQARGAMKAAGRESLPLVQLDHGAPTREHSDVAADIGFEELLKHGETTFSLVDRPESAPCVLNFTSGSTGLLKAAVQTQGNRLANVRKRLMAPEPEVSPATRYLVAGPITHASGMVVLAMLSRGAQIHVLPQWDVGDFLEHVEKRRITNTFLVPTMLNMLLEDERTATADLTSLHDVRLGGAPVSPKRLQQAFELFGPVVSQGYGQAETTSGVTLLTADDIARGVDGDPEILTSCGRAVFDTQVKVIDDDGVAVGPGVRGELAIRGADCVTEYWKAADLTKSTFVDGWVLTGDICYLRPDGYIVIVDRKKDMIISGGFNIYCSEVESALYEHPAVNEVCVVGTPDEKWGEAVKAVIVLSKGADVDEAELIAYCGERIGRHKKPRSIDFFDQLPHNRNGKIDRHALKQRYAQTEGSISHV